ncbi:g6233 [Coccomyxa elongata]
MQLPPEEELHEMIADPKKKRSARTVQLTISNLRRLQERGFDFADPDKVVARLREAHKPLTARTYISALINYLRASGKHAAALGEYRKELVRLEKEIGIDYHRAAYTDRQRAQLVGWEDIDVFPADNVFPIYKTAKHYGSAKVPVPIDLRKAVRKSLELHPREYGFANFAKPGTPWRTQYMSNRMGAVL